MPGRYFTWTPYRRDLRQCLQQPIDGCKEVGEKTAKLVFLVYAYVTLALWYKGLRIDH